MPEKIIYLSEIVSIINLFGNTDNCKIDFNDITVGDKTFKVRKVDDYDEELHEEKVVIEIKCSDGRTLVIRGLSHFMNKSHENDYDTHVIHIRYGLPNNQVLSCEAGIKQLFDEHLSTSLYDAFRSLTVSDLVEGRLNSKYDRYQYEPLTAYHATCDDRGVEYPSSKRRIVWSDLINNEGTYGAVYISKELHEISESFSKAILTKEELESLNKALEYYMENFEQFKANQTADDILSRLTPIELIAIRSKIDSYIPKQSNLIKK